MSAQQLTVCVELFFVFWLNRQKQEPCFHPGRTVIGLLRNSTCWPRLLSFPSSKGNLIRSSSPNVFVYLLSSDESFSPGPWSTEGSGRLTFDLGTSLCFSSTCLRPLSLSQEGLEEPLSFSSISDWHSQEETLAPLILSGAAWRTIENTNPWNIDANWSLI